MERHGSLDGAVERRHAGRLEGEACRLIRLQRIVGRVDHRVGQAADPPHDRHRAVAQAVELGQAARLEARGHEDRVGAGNQAVREGFVVADAHSDRTRIRLRHCSERGFERRLAGTLQRELAAACEQTRYRAEHEVEPLLRGEAADHAEQRRIGAHGQAEFGLQCGLAARLAAELGRAVACRDAGVGCRVPDRAVDTVEHAAHVGAAAADHAVETEAEFRRRDLPRIGRADGGDAVGEFQAGLDERQLLVVFEPGR